MGIYAALVAREDRWWVIDVHGVGIAQARRLSDVEQMARELVAVTLDVPFAEVRVEVRRA